MLLGGGEVGEGGRYIGIVMHAWVVLDGWRYILGRTFGIETGGVVLLLGRRCRIEDMLTPVSLVRAVPDREPEREGLEAETKDA